MNLNKARHSSKIWSVSVHLISINKLALTRPQHYPWTALGSVNGRVRVSLMPRLFFARRGEKQKIVWSTAYSISVLCGLKIGDTMSSKMTSHKAWKYKKALINKRDGSLQGSSFSELLNAKKQRFTKREALSTSESPETILSIFESPGTSHCQFSSSETYTACSYKCWHSFAGRALVLLGLVSCIALQLPSLLWLPSIAVRDIIRMKQSDWSATIVVHRTKIE